MWKMGDIMKNSKGDIEFEIIDDGLRNEKWHVSANGTDEEAENVDKQRKMVITGHSTNTAVDEELADGIKEAEKLEKLSNKLNEYCKKNGIAENKAKQNNAADIFLENKERLECIKEQVGDVIKAEEDCKQNGTPFIDAYKEVRKQSVKKRIEELAETDDLRTENCSCGSNNKAEKTMAKMAIIYDFIDSLRDDLTIAEVKRRFF
jgi:arsenate reductase-like glutaredoxin family protein